LTASGRPNFGLNYYALNAKGDFGAASIFSGGTFAVNDGTSGTIRKSAFLFKA
jgi:hypothetical protein